MLLTLKVVLFEFDVEFATVLVLFALELFVFGVPPHANIKDISVNRERESISLYFIFLIHRQPMAHRSFRRCPRVSVMGSSLEGAGTPGKIRTCDPLIRSQILYPAELRVHNQERF